MLPQELIIDALFGIVIDVRHGNEHQMQPLAQRRQRRDEAVKAFDGGRPAEGQHEVGIEGHAVGLQRRSNRGFVLQSEDGVVDENT